MAAKMTIQTRTQLPVYTAEALAAKNPSCSRAKSSMNPIPDATNSATARRPGTHWPMPPMSKKYPHCGGRCKGECFTSNPRPTLRIRFLNAAASEYSTTRMHESESRALRSCARPAAGSNSCRTDFHATSCRGHRHASTVPFESDKADKSGWLPVISVEALFGRWVTRISDTSYCGKVKFDLHRGINICGRGAGQDEFGKLKMYVSFYSGVVLFVGDAQRRIEGPRSYFKVAASNCGLTPSVLHI